MRIHAGGLIGWAAALSLVSAVSASAQTVTPPIPGATTTKPDLTLANTIGQAVGAVGPARAGEAISLGAELAIATAPFGVSTGGFLIKLDPATGLQVRTATTFGPSFAERALTSGEGSVNIGVSYMSSEYNRLGSGSFDGLTLRTTTGSVAGNSREATSNLTVHANTTVIAARMGVTDNLDVGVNLPIVSVKVGGSTSLVNGSGQMLTFASAAGMTTGLGDLTGIVKYRFHSFGSGLPDPGGLAVMGAMRLPTGSRDNLRGLGITRTMVSFIYSSGQKRFRPHANAGFEFWSDGVSATSESGSTVTARNQLQYAAGFEFEAAPKCTLLLDLLGGRIFGGGKIGYQDDPAAAGLTSSRSLVALPEGLTRLSLAPGAKVNLKGKLLLSVNALVALKDDGLHARVTPVAGLELTF